MTKPDSARGLVIGWLSRSPRTDRISSPVSKLPASTLSEVWLAAAGDCAGEERGYVMAPWRSQAAKATIVIRAGKMIRTTSSQQQNRFATLAHASGLNSQSGMEPKASVAKDCEIVMQKSL